MRNWRTLGESDKEGNAQNWFYLGLILLGVFAVLIVTRASPVVLTLISLAYLAYLIAWYFTAGRLQIKYVEKKYEDSYPRKPWGMALFVGITIFAAYVVVLRLVAPECTKVSVLNPYTNQIEWRCR
jgi:threonine/homoserine/homoserine lactone efflux protein